MSEKVKAIKEAIKAGKYDLKGAIEHAAERIVENPESLLWS